MEPWWLSLMKSHRNPPRQPLRGAAPCGSGPSSNWVPPTARFQGVEARPDTARPDPTASPPPWQAAAAAVAAGHQDGDALGRGLGPEIAEEDPFRGPHAGLALAEAEAHDRGQVAVDDALGREIDPVGGAGGGRGHEPDGGVAGHGPGPFHVQVGLLVLFGALVARVGSVDEEFRAPGGQPVLPAEGVHVTGGDVGPAHHGDGDPGAVRSFPVQGLQVVDGREIARGEVAGRIQPRAPQGDRGEAQVHGPQRDIVQGGHPRHHVGQGPGDGRVGAVALAHGPPHLEPADGGAEGLLHLPHRARESDRQPPRRQCIHPESFGAEPGGDPVQGLGIRAEPFPELLRGQPLVEVRAAGIPQAGQEPLQALFRPWGRLEGQDHALHGRVRIRRSSCGAPASRGWTLPGSSTRSARGAGRGGAGGLRPAPGRRVRAGRSGRGRAASAAGRGAGGSRSTPIGIKKGN